MKGMCSFGASILQGMCKKLQYINISLQDSNIFKKRFALMKCVVSELCLATMFNLLLHKRLTEFV